MYVSWNSSAATATANLASAQSATARATQQAATGLSVNDSADSAALWAMATANYSAADAVSTMASAQEAFAAPVFSASQSAVSSVNSVLDDMRDNLVAIQGGGDSSAILSSLQAQGQALSQAVSSAGAGGVNPLDDSTASSGGSTFLLGYSEYAGGSSSQSLNVPAASLVASNGSGVLQTAQAAGSSSATNLTALTANDVSPANIAQTLANLNAAAAAVASVGASMGQGANQISAANAFALSMQNNLQDGAAAMDNADMGAVATQLAASNVQQQLAAIASGIANRSSAATLRLFQASQPAA